MSEIKTGIVSTVNTTNKTARVYFPELEENVSYELGMVDNGVPLPEVDEEVLCVFLTDSPETGFILKIMR